MFEPLETRQLLSAAVAQLDPYEPNNLRSDAYVLDAAAGSLSERDGLATATDGDWYRVSAGAGDFFAELASSPQNGAFSTAVLIHDALTAGDVNAYLYWQATSNSELGDVFSLGAQNNFDTAKASSFRHFSQHIRPDAERIEVTSGDDSILASGHLNEDGSITYVIINRGGETDNSLTLSLPDILPSESGTLSFAVPGYSVTTLTTLPD